MQGKSTFRGHPVHLMLISFPIAFWTGTLATDLIGRWSGDPFWFRMSVVLIAMGTIAGLIASVFGFVDYRTIAMTRQARRVATLHMAGSLVALVVFPLAYLLRRSDHASVAGIAATALGTLVLLAAGYWGSELAVRFGVGFPESVAPARKP